MDAEDLTWDLLTTCDPRLAALEVMTRSARPATDGRFCANRVWACGIKPILLTLVGWERGVVNQAEDPNAGLKLLKVSDLRNLPGPLPAENNWEKLLRTQRAWDIAHERLFGLLPYCHDCMCA